MLNPATTLILNITIIAILYFSSFQIWRGDLSKGQLIAIINYISQMLLAIIVFSNLIMIYTRAYTSAIRVKSVLDIRLQDDKYEDNKIENNNIELKNISFSYTDKKFIKDFNLKIKKGEILGIIGQAGSGKSTLLKLLNRSYEPSLGKIYIGSEDIDKYSNEKIKESIVLISQKTDFFKVSIKENVVLGRENITDEDVINALKRSCAWEFVKNLPNGINTVLENNASNLSGGQKQRILIARCFIGNPKIILLDDSTSALDKKTETEVWKNIYDYVSKNKITTVVCSQKISAFKYADNILVLANGKIEAIDKKENIEKVSKTYKEMKSLSE